MERGSHDPGGLGPPMAQGDVCQVEQGRPVASTRIHDLEYGLEVSIQINQRTRGALECQRLAALVPPAMGYPAREPYGLAEPCVNALATDLDRQGAGRNHALLILEVMNVQEGSILVRGQGAAELED